MREFVIGEEVLHENLGKGKVVEIQERPGFGGVKDLPIVKVEFETATRENVTENQLPGGQIRYIREMTNIFNFRPDTLEEHLLSNDVLNDEEN